VAATLIVGGDGCQRLVYLDDHQLPLVMVLESIALKETGESTLDLALESASEHESAVYIFSGFRGGYDNHPQSLRQRSMTDAHLHAALRSAPAGRPALGQRHVLRQDSPAPGRCRHPPARGAPAPVGRRVRALLPLGVG